MNETSQNALPSGPLDDLHRRACEGDEIAANELFRIAKSVADDKTDCATIRHLQCLVDELEIFRKRAKRFSRDDFEDILHNVVLKLPRSIFTSRNDQRNRFHSFVFKLISNCAYDYLRQIAREQKAVAKLGRFPHEADAPSASMEKKELHGLISNAIDKLTSWERSLVTLRYYEGLSTEEICICLRNNFGRRMKTCAVRVALLRVREKLENILEGMGL